MHAAPQFISICSQPTFLFCFVVFVFIQVTAILYIMSKKMKVCVVGAGGAGLCAARNLSRLSQLFQIDVFEQTESVGGTWVYTPETGTRNGLPIHQSMYKNLR